MVGIRPEPANSFFDALQKALWAQHLINVLDHGVNEYFKEQNYFVQLVQAPDKSSSSLRVQTPHSWPLDVPCLLGDICHNLRASLDFCLMGIVRLENGPKAGKKTLPIGDNVKGLVASINNMFPPGDTQTKLNDLLVNKIGSHRDYSDGGNRDLMTLNRLSNWQKHNLLVPVVGAIVLPPSARMFSENSGASASFGGADITNSNFNLVSVAGDDVQLDFGNETPTYHLRIHSDYADVREPMLDLLNRLKLMTARSVKAFCETWPSEHNPVINIEEPA